MAFQGDSIFWVEVEKIIPNPFQPRREFDEHKLQELSESVRMYGILQPLTVTRKEIEREDGTFYTEYELIAGERRLRASKLAGLNQVPVIIREGDDSEQEKLELAIIENLQREDLNAVDRALAFRQLADVFGLSHTQVAKKVGRSREYVSNSIRLLALPDYMLTALKKAEMTEGHSRTLLMLNDRPEEQDVVFREILLKKLSVREVERIVRKIATDKVRKKHPGEFDAELIEIEKKFMETLGTRVQIQKTDYGGQLTIDYFSVDDLEVIFARMKQEQAGAPTAAAVVAASAGVLSEHTALDVALDDTGKDSFDQSSEDFMTLQEPEILDTHITTNEPEVPIISQENPQVRVSASLSAFAPAQDLMRRAENLPAIPPEYSLLTRTENHPAVETYATPANIAKKVEAVAPVPVNNLYPSQRSESIPEVPAPVNYSYIPKPPEHIPVAPFVPVEPVYAVVETPINPLPPVPPLQQQVPVSEVSVAPIPPAPKEDDDSGMYSIRNFSV